MLNNERVEPLRRLLEDPEFQGLVDDGNWKKYIPSYRGASLQQSIPEHLLNYFSSLV